MITKDVIENKRYAQLTAESKRALELISLIRESFKK
jgi:hypothetical protein